MPGPGVYNGTCNDRVVIRVFLFSDVLNGTADLFIYFGFEHVS